MIAATNRDLLGMVQEHAFRADLYYRLNVFPITVPPLRERTEDIPLLAAHFVRMFAEQQGKVIDEIPDDIVEALKHYHWPGNIRELQNVTERAVIVTKGRVLQSPTALTSRPAVPMIRTLADSEREHIVAALREANWIVGGWNGAAAKLGIPRTTLIAKMERLGLSRTTVKRHNRRQEFERPSFASDLAPLSDTIRLMMERNEPIPELHGNDQSCQ